MKISRWAVPGLVGVLALSISAVASAGVTTVKSPSRSVNSFQRLAVSCPKKSQALSGGFSTGALTQINRPLGGRKWQVETYTNLPGKFHSQLFARCEPKRTGELKRVSHSLLVASGARGVVSATCPKGTIALAGGYADAPPYDGSGNNLGEIAADSSKRTGSRAWTVAGTNHGDPTHLVAYAVCGKPADRGKVKTATATKTLVAPTTTATARCEKGWHTLGGGFKAPTEAQGIFPVISVSAPSGSRGWTTSLPGAMVPIGTKLSSYAYCAKNPS